MNRRRNYWAIIKKLIRSQNWQIVWIVLAFMVALQLFFAMSANVRYVKKPVVKSDVSVFEDNEFIDNNAEVPVAPNHEFNFDRGEN
ncbi:MAG: hypothetical protein ACI376_03660 [Candidatus Bruticola sp.]